MQNKPTYVHIQFLDSAQLQAASLAWFFFAVLSSLESTYTSCYPPIYSKVLLDQWLLCFEYSLSTWKYIFVEYISCVLFIQKGINNWKCCFCF